MMVIDGTVYPTQTLPAIFFGLKRPLAYVGNPKVASTFALNFLFFINHGYRYFNPVDIYNSPLAVARLEAPEIDPRALKAYYALSPETFTMVRDPLRRFVSGFLNKVFTDVDTNYGTYRDMLTCLHGIDLSPEANPRRSALAFATWLAAQPDPMSIDPHFRPQHLNLAAGSRFRIDTILRLEDQDALLAFLSRWTSAEKARWFLTMRFTKSSGYAHDDVVSDELEELVRTIYARDYQLFYASEAARRDDAA